MNGQLTSKINIPKNPVELINLVFAELEITFHNQFHKAFPDEETLNLAKQLWLAKLERFDNELIFEAIDKIIESSKYLPSLSAVLSEIKELIIKKKNIPSSEKAYLEASSLGEVSPLEFAWSHPFVYHAGTKLGWYRLKTEAEFYIKKEFIKIYDEILNSTESEENFSKLPSFETPKLKEKPLSKEKQILRLESLKKKYL
jgi:hypothetical protein